MTFSYSVVIPAYNAAATIGQAVQSILDQTVRPQEIIVVDDGSTDGTAAAVAGMGSEITLISQDNRGPGAATTAGFGRVVTPFVATLDADDLWLPAEDRASSCPLPQRSWPCRGVQLGTSVRRRRGSRSERPGRHTAPVDAHHLTVSHRGGTRGGRLCRPAGPARRSDRLARPQPRSWSAPCLGGRDLGTSPYPARQPFLRSAIAERSRGYLAAVRAALERKRQMSKKSKPTSV